MLYALNMPLAQSILRELSANGPISRAEIAAALDVSGSSLRLHLEALEAAGLIEADSPPGHRQGKRVRYAVRVDGVVNAVDTLLAFVLASNDYRVGLQPEREAD